MFFGVGKISPKQMRQIGSVGTLGLELGLSLLIGIKAGEWLDLKFGTTPWLLRVGFLVGMAAGIRSVYQVVMKAQKELEAEKEKQE